MNKTRASLVNSFYCVNELFYCALLLCAALFLLFGLRLTSELRSGPTRLNVLLHTLLQVTRQQAYSTEVASSRYCASLIGGVSSHPPAVRGQHLWSNSGSMATSRGWSLGEGMAGRFPEKKEGTSESFGWGRGKFIVMEPPFATAAPRLRWCGTTCQGS